MRTIAGKGWLLACAALCAAIAGLHQPRPAIGALITTTALAVGGARKIALLACLVAAFGLIATTPTITSTPQHAEIQTR
jgi:hypothetical protein